MEPLPCIQRIPGEFAEFRAAYKLAGKLSPERQSVFGQVGILGLDEGTQLVRSDLQIQADFAAADEHYVEQLGGFVYERGK